MKIKNILILLIVLITLTIVSFCSAYAYDEGNYSDNLLINILAHVFQVLRFPTHILFKNTINKNQSLYFGGLIINCIFYAVLIEKINKLYRKTK